MPISEIGRIKPHSQPGYTLIEILAVLIILSLIGLLVFPRFDGGEEKAYLKQIGKLIQADIQTVSEEAAVEKSEIIVELFSNGYCFEIGDIEIRRVFDKYQFHWDFPGQETEAADSLKLFTKNNESFEPSNLELSFNSDGDFPEDTVQWASQNFTGSLLFKSDGSVNWNYAPRKI